MAFLGFFFLLAFLFTEDDATEPVETTAYFSYDAELAEGRFSLALAVSFTLFGFSHIFLSLFYRILDSSLLFFYRLIKEVCTC